MAVVQQRSVGFNELKNNIHENTSYCFEEIEDQWYSCDETEEMKKSSNFTAQIARRTASSGAESYTGALEIVYKACCEGSVSTQEQEALKLQQQLWVARSGLELKICKSAPKDKSARRKQMIQLIYNVTNEDELALQCSETSRPACLFAQLIAQS